MIYLLEDDESIRNFVLYGLNNSGLETLGFERPSCFWKAVSDRMPDLVLLDIMLPEEDGITILKKLRESKRTKMIPIIMLTAKDTELDKVNGFECGADDYVTKPFGAMELIARVKALLRRADYTHYSDSSHDFYKIKNLYINFSAHRVTVDGREVSLTLKEFQLLRFLVENMGEVMTRDEILQNIWGYEFDGENRTVDVHIRTLRSKLRDAGEIIQTVRGIGYMIGENK